MIMTSGGSQRIGLTHSIQVENLRKGEGLEKVQLCFPSHLKTNNNKTNKEVNGGGGKDCLTLVILFH